MDNKILEIQKLKKKNRLLIKETENKYFENRSIDSQLDYMGRIQNTMNMNSKFAVVITFLVFMCSYALVNQLTEINTVNSILLLLTDSALSVLVGTKVGNKINELLLKKEELIDTDINETYNELKNRKEQNVVLIDRINKELMNNNNLIDDLSYELNNTYNEYKSNTNNKVKKLSLKKII